MIDTGDPVRDELTLPTVIDADRDPGNPELLGRLCHLGLEGPRLIAHTDDSRRPVIIHQGAASRSLLIRTSGARSGGLPGDHAHSARNGRTSSFRLQAFDPSAASARAASRSQASITQKPARYSLVSR